MKTCTPCGSQTEGSTLSFTGPLHARIRGPVKLCACCSEALLAWLRFGDPSVSSIGSRGRPGRPAMRRSPSWSTDSPIAAAGAS
jgi:hypothetical protein